MGTKKYLYCKTPVPLSYGGDDVPSIHRIVDLIANKELSGWRFVKASKFARDEKTGFFRPQVIKFRRPQRGILRTIIYEYMAITLADDNCPPDKDSGWEMVGAIERDAWKRPHIIIFRREEKNYRQRRGGKDGKR